MASGGIDLFQEVKRFEINLIKLALDQTRGHQARAARLLKINPTTLNSKIKAYGIEF
jgi:DNA-binding NtrC family response regulator